jgi:hypothetical protein
MEASVNTQYQRDKQFLEEGFEDMITYVSYRTSEKALAVFIDIPKAEVVFLECDGQINYHNIITTNFLLTLNKRRKHPVGTHLM